VIGRHTHDRRALRLRRPGLPSASARETVNPRHGGVVSCWQYFQRHYRSEFSPVRHGVLPIIGSLLMLLPIYGLLWPVPPWPYNLVPYLIVAWTLGGIGYFWYLARRRPAMIEAMGRVWEPDPGPAAKPIP
jgi:hypothetical protein